MKKRLKNYLAKAESLTAQRFAGTGTSEQRAAELRDLLVQIRFFQHERLVHLLVTLTVALLFAGASLYVAFAPSVPMLILHALLFVLLVPYIAHYFILENGVQKLYRVYDTWVEPMRE